MTEGVCRYTYLRSARPVQRAWPYKHESLSPFPSTLSIADEDRSKMEEQKNSRMGRAGFVILERENREKIRRGE